MEIADLLMKWSTLVGIAALIAVVINILKVVGVVKDGQAATWSTGLNLVGLAVLLLLGVFKPELDMGEVDTLAGSLANVLTVIMGFVLQLGGSKLMHSLLRGVPLIGKTNSG